MRAHSTKLEKNTTTTGTKETSDSEDTQAQAGIPPKTSTGILAYMNPAKISEQHKIKIEWLMFRMFICCALPWALMDSRFFIDFIHALAPNFTVPDRSAFFPKHLAQEVAVWGENSRCFLMGGPT